MHEDTSKDTADDRMTKLIIMMVIAKQGFGNHLECPNKVSDKDASILSKAAKDNGVILTFKDTMLQSKYGVAAPVPQPPVPQQTVEDRGSMSRRN